jgi:hypothetical protein
MKMALLLRVLTKPKWVRPAGMLADDIPADVLSDLRSTNNMLSVWMVEANGDGLDVAITALASARARLDKLDYALIDEAILPEIAIRCVRSEGNSPNITANGSAHRDLTELTVQNVSQLARRIMPLEKQRVTEARVKRLLLDALERGVLDRNRMDPKLLSELEPPVRP